jgi:hypothetical protein
MKGLFAVLACATVLGFASCNGSGDKKAEETHEQHMDSVRTNVTDEATKMLNDTATKDTVKSVK